MRSNTSPFASLCGKAAGISWYKSLATQLSIGLKGAEKKLTIGRPEWNPLFCHVFSVLVGHMHWVVPFHDQETTGADPEGRSTFVLVVGHRAREELFEAGDVLVGDVFVKVSIVKRPQALPKSCNVS